MTGAERSAGLEQGRPSFRPRTGLLKGHPPVLVLPERLPAPPEGSPDAHVGGTQGSVQVATEPAEGSTDPSEGSGGAGVSPGISRVGWALGWGSVLGQVEWKRQARPGELLGRGGAPWVGGEAGRGERPGRGGVKGLRCVEGSSELWVAWGPDGRVPETGVGEALLQPPPPAPPVLGPGSSFLPPVTSLLGPFTTRVTTPTTPSAQWAGQRSRAAAGRLSGSLWAARTAGQGCGGLWAREAAEHRAEEEVDGGAGPVSSQWGPSGRPCSTPTSARSTGRPPGPAPRQATLWRDREWGGGLVLRGAGGGVHGGPAVPSTCHGGQEPHGGAAVAAARWRDPEQRAL